jgi:ribosome recycling factor
MYDSAYTYMIKAADAMQDDPVIFSHLGAILEVRNDLSGAIAAYKKSILLGSDEQTKIEEKIQNLQNKLIQANKP